MEHTLYHVVVRGGSHFCQSSKGVCVCVCVCVCVGGGGVGGIRSFFKLNAWEGHHFFFAKKNQNSSAFSPPPPLTKKKRNFP